MQDNKKENRNTWDIWNPKMQRFEPNRKIFTEKDKHDINNKWCEYMALIFEKYRDEFEKTIINVPEQTIRIFKKNGINTDGISQDNIYDSFDKIIQNNKHIEDYLKKQRSKYSLKMPF